MLPELTNVLKTQTNNVYFVPSKFLLYLVFRVLQCTCLHMYRPQNLLESNYRAKYICSSIIKKSDMSITVIYLSIMDFLRGQYVIYGPVRIILTEDNVIYGPVRIILTEDDVRGQYNSNRSIYNILTE